MPEFAWSASAIEAAQLVSDGELSYGQIAENVGVSHTTLRKWREHPDFAARVASILEDYREHVRRKGIAVRERRVAALNDRWKRMNAVIDERAGDPAMQKVAGGSTGLIVRDVKGIGKGADFQVVEVYSVDTGLLKELREHERQAAQELGQWAEKREIVDPDDDAAAPDPTAEAAALDRMGDAMGIEGPE